MKNKLYNIVSNNVDIITATAALFLSLILTIYIIIYAKQPIFAVGCAVTFLCCAAYILQKKRLLAFSETQPGLRTRLYLILNILFFILLAGLVLSFYLRPDPYIRPLIFFILVAIMVAIVAAEIIACQLKGSRIYLVLLEIIIIGIIVRWTPVLMYPGVIGVDPWGHQLLTDALLTLGYMPDFAMKYATMPIYHLLVGATSLITNLEYKYATMFSVNLLQVVSDILFIFLMGKAMFNYRVGLLAGLLLTVASYHVQKGYWTIPNTLGVTIILVVLYLLLNLRSKIRLPGNHHMFGDQVISHGFRREVFAKAGLLEAPVRRF